MESERFCYIAKLLLGNLVDETRYVALCLLDLSLALFNERSYR